MVLNNEGINAASNFSKHSCSQFILDVLLTLQNDLQTVETVETMTIIAVQEDINGLGLCPVQLHQFLNLFYVLGVSNPNP